MKRGTPPSAEQIRAARLKYELTQRAAAELIYYTLSGWQRFEQGEREMHPALWEYWQIRVKQEQERRKHA